MLNEHNAEHNILPEPPPSPCCPNIICDQTCTVNHCDQSPSNEPSVSFVHICDAMNRTMGLMHAIKDSQGTSQPGSVVCKH